MVISRLSLFNDERCFLPVHVYDTATSRPVAVLLRTGAAAHPEAALFASLARCIQPPGP
jgi:hypothetical protein